MKSKYYILNQDFNQLKQGDIVKAYLTQKSKTKTDVTNYKVIGLWPCCGCKRYLEETIPNKYLIYLDEFSG